MQLQRLCFGAGCSDDDYAVSQDSSTSNAKRRKGASIEMESFEIGEGDDNADSAHP
jgi:hypothetical protein